MTHPMDTDIYVSVFPLFITILCISWFLFQTLFSTDDKMMSKLVWTFFDMITKLSHLRTEWQLDVDGTRGGDKETSRNSWGVLRSSSKAATSVHFRPRF